MIIKLSGLDYSSNNIGSIGAATDISDFTKSVLSHYTKTLTTPKQKALDTFLSGLKSAGLWAKIENLFFPCLAGTLAETTYNVKKEQQEKVPGSDYYVLQTQGLNLKPQPKGTVIPDDQLAYFNVNGSYMNIHYMVNTAPITWTGDEEYECNKSAYWLTTFASNVYKGIIMVEGNANNRWNLLMHGNPQRYVNPMTYPSLVEVYEGTSIVTGRTDKDQGILNNILGGMNYSETEDKTITNATTFIGTNYAKWETCHLAPMRVFGTGSALSDDELRQYTSLCNAFTDALFK